MLWPSGEETLEEKNSKENLQIKLLVENRI